MIKILGAILTGWLLSAMAYGEEWEFLGSQKGIDVYIDKTSIAHNKHYLKAWFRWDYQGKNTLPTYPHTEFMSAKSLEYFDCEDETRANVQLIFYSGQSGSGEPVSSFISSPTKAQFAKVLPESLEEASLDYACDNGQ